MQILKKINKKRVFQFILVILVVLGIRWYVSRDGLKLVPVRKITVENRVIERTITASGEIKSVNDAVLSFNSLGRVSNITVEKGQKVQKGEYLAQLDYSALGKNIQALKDARDYALRDRDMFIQNYENDKDAYGGEKQYEIRLRQLDEAISQAEATYNSRQYTVNDSYIYAPFDGVVVDVYKEIGESASATESIIKIADIDNLEFEIVLDQEDYGVVKLGQKVRLELDSYPDTVFEGEISDLPFYAVGTSVPEFTVKIKILPNSAATALLGMTGDAEILVYQTTEAVRSVLYDEIFYDEQEKPFLWTNENGYMKKLYVDVGLEGDLYTEITTDVKSEIVVPINDDEEIKEGYKAKITG